jgi:YfiH family protein
MAAVLSGFHWCRKSQPVKSLKKSCKSTGRIEGMKFTKKNGVSFYQFENLAACSGVDHRIFTRNGGSSRPPYASLNVGLGIGDVPQNVLDNRALISRFMAAGQLVFARQVHGREIAVLRRGSEDRDAAVAAGSDIAIADALVTDIDGRNLVIQSADCQAVLLYDPGRRVIANIHTGWRGSVQNIIGRTIKAMAKLFGCRSDRIIAGIGPSLGPCCAEFIHYATEIPRKFWRYRGLNNHFDFWSLSRDQLSEAGVNEVNVENSGICTRCHTDDFFSYRAEKTTGRFAAVIGLTQ